MSRIHKMRADKRGLTLIELIISVALIAIMLGAVWVVYNTSYNVFYGQFSRQNIKDQASRAFITITDELHQALSITTATAASITFTADMNSDGCIETIQYSWSGVSGQPLNRIVGAQTTALARSVDNPAPLADNSLFTYYGANNTRLGSSPVISQIRLVMIDLYTTSGSETFHLRTKVLLRCA
ncbi:MAG: prepilin-type N-terminal cleavage/methylation domain-containing protein [Candidatus Omnitrophota bacterium]